jgi:ubiquinone/menaquinone biosynthesis C-methylase UbiE
VEIAGWKLSPGNVELARRRIAEAGPTVAANVETAVSASFTDLVMFSDGTFDAVLCLGSALSHVIEPDQRLCALTEMRRVARPSTPLLISAGNLLSMPRGLVQ